MTKTEQLSYDDIVDETDSAVLFEIGKRQVWLPKSLIEYDETTKVIELPQWLKEKKDL